MSHKDLLSCGFYIHSAKKTLFLQQFACLSKQKSYQVCWLVHEEKLSVQGV